MSNLADTPLRAARLFHEAYERLAPRHGYTTREETRAWNPLSPNGQLMQDVALEVLGPLWHKLLDRDRENAALREALNAARDGFINLRPEPSENAPMHRQMTKHILAIHDALAGTPPPVKRTLSDAEKIAGGVAFIMGDGGDDTGPAERPYVEGCAWGNRCGHPTRACFAQGYCEYATHVKIAPSSQPHAAGNEIQRQGADSPYGQTFASGDPVTAHQPNKAGTTAAPGYAPELTPIAQSAPATTWPCGISRRMKCDHPECAWGCRLGKTEFHSTVHETTEPK